MRIYITSLVSLAAATFILRHGENFLQRFQKRCRMSSPRQKYAFAAATTSRRGEVQISPRHESCAAAGTRRRRGENLTESIMFQTHSLAAATYIVCRGETIPRRGDNPLSPRRGFYNACLSVVERCRCGEICILPRRGHLGLRSPRR